MPISLIIIAHIGGVLFIISMISNISLNFKKYNSPNPLTLVELYKSGSSLLQAFTPEILDIIAESNPAIKEDITELKNTVIHQRLILQDKIKSFVDEKEDN